MRCSLSFTAARRYLLVVAGSCAAVGSAITTQAECESAASALGYAPRLADCYNRRCAPIAAWRRHSCAQAELLLHVDLHVVDVCAAVSASRQRGAIPANAARQRRATLLSQVLLLRFDCSPVLRERRQDWQLLLDLQVHLQAAAITAGSAAASSAAAAAVVAPSAACARGPPVTAADTALAASSIASGTSESATPTIPTAVAPTSAARPKASTVPTIPIAATLATATAPISATVTLASATLATRTTALCAVAPQRARPASVRVLGRWRSIHVAHQRHMCQRRGSKPWPASASLCFGSHGGSVCACPPTHMRLRRAQAHRRR